MYFKATVKSEETQLILFDYIDSNYTQHLGYLIAEEFELAA